VDTDQEVGPVYLQDSWGIPLVDSDCQTVSLASSPIQVESVPNPYRWGGAHGYYADEDVGMYLMGFRWYDSFTGRFISRDPIGFDGGDMNLYRPMGNNPVNEVDPWGLRGARRPLQPPTPRPPPRPTPSVVRPTIPYRDYGRGGMENVRGLPKQELDPLAPAQNLRDAIASLPEMINDIIDFLVKVKPRSTWHEFDLEVEYAAYFIPEGEERLVRIELDQHINPSFVLEALRAPTPKGEKPPIVLYVLVTGRRPKSLAPHYGEPRLVPSNERRNP
jgi:RHS repeat-associated protein